MRYVYADILFLVNFIFNFSLLYLAGRLAGAPVAGRRLTLAAALGGA
ncbi:MAG TPA: sigma-E processing peptidase SpoIIGA, partial [Clostridiales bacterium]|nr:sigma-E processing peptidase SpoIIGA [Clostridiales bacterium]